MAHKDKKRIMSLRVEKFLRRFFPHVLSQAEVKTTDLGNSLTCRLLAHVDCFLSSSATKQAERPNSQSVHMPWRLGCG
jgi:hypothetical protein